MTDQSEIEAGVYFRDIGMAIVGLKIYVEEVLILMETRRAKSCRAKSWRVGTVGGKAAFEWLVSGPGSVPFPPTEVLL